MANANSDLQAMFEDLNRATMAALGKLQRFLLELNGRWWDHRHFEIEIARLKVEREDDVADYEKKLEGKDAEITALKARVVELQSQLRVYS